MKSWCESTRWSQRSPGRYKLAALVPKTRSGASRRREHYLRTPPFSFRSSKAERPADNRQTVERHHAEGPTARKLSQESAPLKPGRARRNSVASHQISVPVVKEIITRLCEGRVPSAILGGDTSFSCSPAYQSSEPIREFGLSARSARFFAGVAEK